MDSESKTETPEDKKRINQEQKSLLVEFLEQHPELKCGKFSSTFTAKRSKQLWQEISSILNSVPFAAIKSADQWKRTWQDMKKNTKGKAAAIKKYRETTGGGPKTKLELNDTQNRVYELLGETAVHGHNGVPESNASFDFGNGNQIENRRDDNIEYLDDIQIMEKHVLELDKKSTNSVLTTLASPIASVSSTALMTPASPIASVSSAALTTPASPIASVSTTPLVDRINKRKDEKALSESKDKKPRLFSTKRLENTVEASKKLAEIGESKNKMKSSYYDKKISLMEREVIATEEKVSVLKEISNNLQIIANSILINNLN